MKPDPFTELMRVFNMKLNLQRFKKGDRVVYLRNEAALCEEFPFLAKQRLLKKSVDAHLSENQVYIIENAKSDQYIKLRGIDEPQHKLKFRSFGPSSDFLYKVYTKTKEQ